MKTKEKILKMISVTLLILSFEGKVSAQIYGNLVGIVSHGTTDTADYAPIMINSDGKVIVAGNQYAAVNQQYDATLSAELATGVIDWQNAVTSGSKAFNTASTHDSFGNIYVVGGKNTSPTNGFDYFVAKYTASGSQIWIQYYNGTNSTNDVASAVCLDASGNVYVTGGSEGTSGALIDMVTIKYNSSGAQQWVSRYNYANSVDIPVAIALTSSSKVVVSGSSGSTYLSWDYTTIEYNTSSGAQTASNRTPSSGLQDMVYSMVTDASGNVYVTGTTSGANANVRTLKLDGSLNTVWTQTLDLHGYNDAGVGIALDNSNNIVITGFSYFANGTRELFVAKYNNAGSLQWLKSKKDPQPGSTAEGLRVTTNSNNDIFVGGNYTVNGNQDIIVLRYASSGDLKFERRYNGTANNSDKFMDFTIDNDKIYISAKTYSTPTVDQNITIQYSTKTFSQGVATTTLGVKYEPKEVIVQFHKSVLKMATINNKQILYGKLSDFVNDSTCNKITAKLDPYNHYEINAKNFDTRKIFLNLTEADSLSESRTGGFVKIQKYYCYLLLTMPASVNNIVAAQSLNTLKPDLNHAEMNVYMETASPQSANDPYFAVEQGGLHATATFSNSHVNADSAWAIKGGGEPFVRVGVMDTGVEFPHTDFGGATAWGYDFINITGQSGDSDNHGTGTAGLIGAVRNNNIGVAGIAGKDALGAPQGVTLYDCKVCQNAICPTDKFANGLLTAINGTNLAGYGVHLVNMSIRMYTTFENTYGTAPQFTLPISIMNDANRLGVAMCAAKGNLVDVSSYSFPADYSDQTTMSIGSTGTNGHRCVYGNNCSNGSTTGGNIDFCAPGTDSLVYVLDNGLGYKVEDGTSFATPHVSGAIALMMSYRNKPFPFWDNMVHEDCEAILQRTAVDLSSPSYTEAIGPDSVTGYGRINIMRAMREINKDYYRFRHITESVGSNSSSRSVSTISTNVTMLWNGLATFPTGTASTNVYELTSTINYTLLPTETLIDAWPLYKESYGSANASEVFIDRPYYSKIVSVSATQAVMKTYYYRFNPTGVYAPYPSANSHSCAITLYTYDSSGSVNIEERSSSFTGSVKIYPNPSTGEFKVDLWSESNADMQYRVNNILGQSVLGGTYKAQAGDNKFALDASSLGEGIYIFTIFSGTKPVYSQKIIKQ